MIKFQKSQALTSHFESFWSIVHLDEKLPTLQFHEIFYFSGSKEYDVPFDINLRDVNGQTVLYLACCVGNLKIVELLLKYQVKARKVSGKTATLKKKKTGSKDDQSKPSMVATRTSFQTVPTPQQSSIQVSLFFRQIDCFKKKKKKGIGNCVNIRAK